MAKVLVTGGTGFIGRHTLAPLAERGYEIHVAGYGAADLPEGATLHETDLLNEKTQRALIEAVQPTHLIHFAWEVTPGKYVTSFLNHAWVAASMHLLDLFKAHGGQRAVLAGTCFEYEFGGDIMHETKTPSEPNTLYGRCKNELRQKATAWAKENDLPLAWARIFYLYGPQEHPNRLVSAVINNLLRNQVAPCSEGKQMLDFMHVQDVADAFVAVLESSVTDTINIAGGERNAVCDIVNKIAEFTGNADKIDRGAYPTRPSDPDAILGDTTRLSQEAGWSPRFTLHTGIEDTVNWWREKLSAEGEI